MVVLPRQAKERGDAKAAPEGAGHVWTWTALAPDTKLIVSYFVGDRSSESAMVMMDDLRERLDTSKNPSSGVIGGVLGRW